MKATLNASQFVALLSGASAGISTAKDTKGVAVLNVVRLEGSDGKITAVATDRYVMARGTIAGLSDNGAGVINLTANNIKIIAQVLKPLKSREITITLGDSLTIEGGASLIVPNSAVLENYPDINKLIPTEFSGVDSDGIILDPAVITKASKVTPARILWRFNGGLKSMFGTATDSYGIDWEIMLMPCRAQG